MKTLLAANPPPTTLFGYCNYWTPCYHRSVISRDVQNEQKQSPDGSGASSVGDGVTTSFTMRRHLQLSHRLMLTHWRWCRLLILSWSKRRCRSSSSDRTSSWPKWCLLSLSHRERDAENTVESTVANIVAAWAVPSCQWEKRVYICRPFNYANERIRAL